MASGAVSYHSYDENGKEHGKSRVARDAFRCGKGEIIPYQQVTLCKYEHGEQTGLHIEDSTYGAEDAYFVEPEKQKQTKTVRQELRQMQFEDNRNSQLGRDKRSQTQQIADRAQFLYKKYNCEM